MLSLLAWRLTEGMWRIVERNGTTSERAIKSHGEDQRATHKLPCIMFSSIRLDRDMSTSGSGEVGS